MKFTVEIEESELEHLAQWHREQQWEAAEKERYTDADWHKKRAAQLLEHKRIALGKSDGR